MLYAFVVIGIVVLVVLAVSNAYAIWYAKSGRYELDHRLDAVTRHQTR
jgi:hypothetical protein